MAIVNIFRGQTKNNLMEEVKELDKKTNWQTRSQWGRKCYDPNRIGGKFQEGIENINLEQALEE